MFYIRFLSLPKTFYFVMIDMGKSFERMYWMNEITDKEMMKLYADIRYWLNPDRSLVSEDIKILCDKLNNLCEIEMIKLMKKWCPINMSTSLEDIQPSAG